MSYKDYIQRLLVEDENSEWKEVNGHKINSVLTKDMPLKSGKVIPQGTKIEFVFVKKGYRYAIKVLKLDPSIEVDKTIYINAGTQKIAAIKKQPTMTTLYNWTLDKGNPKSVTGKTVEPDGESYDGSPSWLLVLGMI